MKTLFTTIAALAFYCMIESVQHGNWLAMWGWISTFLAELTIVLILIEREKE
jgi:hypothetical protein